MQPVIPDALAAILPIVGEILTRVLADDRQKAGINALIAGAFLVLCATGCALLAGNFTGDPATSAGIVIAYCTLLMRGSLGTLMQFFGLAPSPAANLLFGPQIESTAPAKEEPKQA